MFRIKICGITTLEDARHAAAAGADAIGLNFYEKSPRYVQCSVAKEIACDLGDSTYQVGVFVNASQATMQSVSKETSLDAIQLHGDEPPDLALAASILGRPVIRVRALGEQGIAALAEDLAACRDAGWEPAAVLVDARTPGQYGGTGKTIDWSQLAEYRQWLKEVPLILAGGLSPENITEAIRTVRPHGVDVASGVESMPGVKDQDKVQSFIAQAKAAFENLA